MKTKMHAGALLIAAWLLGCAVSGQARAADVDDRLERQRIDAEIRAAEQRFAQRERDCKQRFVVTSCVDEAKGERREALDRLRRQRVLLDEAQRKKRADERREEIRAKVEEQAQRETDKTPREPHRPKGAASDAAAPGVERKAPTPRVRESHPAPAPVPAAARRAAAQKRQDEAQAHRESNERRNAKQATRGKTGQPLPVPSSIPASSP